MAERHEFSDPSGNGYCFECGLRQYHPEANHYVRLETVQLLRFLDEACAVLTEEQYNEMSISMDLSVEEVHEFLTCCSSHWERVKAMSERISNGGS